MGAWFGRRMTIGSSPLPAVDGEMWFDICELALMVCVGRAWLATRPVAQWQMRGFLEVAHRTPRVVQVTPPYRALDQAQL